MRLAFLPINQAWAFLFGNDIATAQIISMDGAYLFASRKDAVAAAQPPGQAQRGA